MFYIQESTCEILRRFGTTRSHSAPPVVIIWRPQSDSEPGELRPPCPSRYAPDDSITGKEGIEMRKLTKTSILQTSSSVRPYTRVADSKNNL